MVHPRPQSASLDLETLLSHAHRCRDLLTGSVALMSGSAPLMVPTAHNVVLEARAELDAIVGSLESLAAVEAEGKRALQLHKDEQARVTASCVGMAK